MGEGEKYNFYVHSDIKEKVVIINITPTHAGGVLFSTDNLRFPVYVGHPIKSDNGLISQNPLFKSEFYNPLHVPMSVAYSCLKYGEFITT